jgi:hypothetical protein
VVIFSYFLLGETLSFTGVFMLILAIISVSLIILGANIEQRDHLKAAGIWKLVPYIGLVFNPMI